MNDFDADEVVPPLNTNPNRFRLSTDTILGTAGVLMAAGAAFLPWYVILNQEKFTLHVVPREMTRDMPDTGPRPIWNVSPMSIPNKDQPKVATLPADPVKTGTTPDEKTAAVKPPVSDANQPFPDHNFVLLHVSNGKALIKDDKGVYLVQVGSALPDNSKLATIEERNGKQVIVTSDGSVINQSH